MAARQDLNIRIAAISAADDFTALPFPSTLVEISCPSPKSTALAVILDQSDSCGPMIDEADKLPRLLRSLPRDWEVWIYRLSEKSSLRGPAQHTVAHLQDASLRLSDWLGSRECRTTAKDRGSLILPVLEGIDRRKKERHVERVVALALTDGELLDSAAIQLPSDIHIAGIAKVVSPQARIQWRRVLGDAPLFNLSESAIDDWLRSQSSSFFGSTQVSWKCVRGGSLNVAHFDPNRQCMRSLSNPGIEWNLKDGPLFLLLQAQSADLDGIHLSCSNPGTGHEEVLKLSKANAVIPLKLLSILRRVLAGPSSVALDAIVDHSPGTPDFHVTAQWMTRAAEMSEQRRKWTGNDGILNSLEPSGLRASLVNDDGDLRWDALLCLCRLEPGGQARSYSRVVVFGLNRQSRPALQWRAKQSLSFGTTGTAVCIEYDPRESRWMISYDESDRHEFDPRGSRVLPRQLVEEEGVEWSAFFSGDLNS